MLPCLPSESLTFVSVPFYLKTNIVVKSFECVLEIRGKNWVKNSTSGQA